MLQLAGCARGQRRPHHRRAGRVRPPLRFCLRLRGSSPSGSAVRRYAPSVDHSNPRIRSDVNEYIRYLMDEAAGRLGAAATALSFGTAP